ncbi:putative membrane protein [Friedmanniella endophytica]|uniref:Putative membrane protein n=1 Tax=Microlunatus kandeliicorticis TaxID=1759536 RepID=A0A7W3P7L1_9ACTN|nr:putative membrane protein [Microlunatus kandeliicorticis]
MVTTRTGGREGSVVVVVGLVLALLAGALHVYIFVLESLLWTTPRARAVFGTTEAEAAATRQLAYNQGFYNLFLAVLAVLGVVLAFAGVTVVGTTLVVAGCGSMVAAALVLLTSDRSKQRAALTQMAFALLALIALALSVVV